MADSMLQLAVAKKAMQMMDRTLSGSFLLGVIAPDSVRIRPGATPKDYELTHAIDPDWTAAWKAGLALLKAENKDSYLAGCAVHILTDSLWAGYRAQIIASMPEDMKDEEKNAAIRRETEELERVLYLSEGGAALMRAILATPIISDRGYLGLNTQEVDAWRHRVDEVLHSVHKGEAIVYLTQAVVDQFLTKAAGRICREWMRIEAEK